VLLQFPSTIQTWLLYHNALSQGVLIDDIINYTLKTKADQSTPTPPSSRTPPPHPPRPRPSCAHQPLTGKESAAPASSLARGAPSPHPLSVVSPVTLPTPDSAANPRPASTLAHETTPLIEESKVRLSKTPTIPLCLPQQLEDGPLLSQVMQLVPAPLQQNQSPSELPPRLDGSAKRPPRNGQRQSQAELVQPTPTAAAPQPSEPGGWVFTSPETFPKRG
jgi:hypothetical protein